MTRHKSKKKRRFAYLANENLRNFQHEQEVTRRFSRLAWAAVSYLARKVFSGPSFGGVVMQSTLLYLRTDRLDCKVIKNIPMKKHKILGLFAVGMLLLSSCGGYTSVTASEAYEAGYTIGRIISGN